MITFIESSTFEQMILVAATKLGGSTQHAGHASHHDATVPSPDPRPHDRSAALFNNEQL